MGRFFRFLFNSHVGLINQGFIGFALYLIAIFLGLNCVRADASTGWLLGLVIFEFVIYQYYMVAFITVHLQEHVGRSYAGIIGLSLLLIALGVTKLIVMVFCAEPTAKMALVCGIPIVTVVSVGWLSVYFYVKDFVVIIRK